MAPIMELEAESRFRRRRYRADECGVSEFDSDGDLCRFIPWQEISRVGRDGIRSDQGIRIRFPGRTRTWNEFFGAVHEEWKGRYPYAWRHERARRHRSVQRGLFIWMPLFNLGPGALMHLLVWLKGSPPTIRDEISKIDRLTLFGLLLIFGLWLLYLRWRRQGVYDA